MPPSPVWYNVSDDSATAAHNRNGDGKHARPIETRPGILHNGKTGFLSISPPLPSVKREGQQETNFLLPRE